MANKAEEEVWIPYPKYPFIEVSNLGRVRTKDRYVPLKNGGKRFIKGRILKQQFDKDGYMCVGFGAGGKVVRLFVHRMVAICYIPNPNNLPEVNHIDCNRANNTMSNLEWCTSQYNTAYRVKLGRTAKHNAPKKPVIAINLETSKIFLFESHSEAARQLGVDVGNINGVTRGKRYNKTAGGYWFCNADENAVEKTREKFGDEVARKVEELMNQNQN